MSTVPFTLEPLTWHPWVETIDEVGATPEQAALVAFLKSLTDERVRFERAPFDHPQIFVPNGHPGDQNQVLNDGTGKARDALIEVPAVGAGGGLPLSPVF